MSDGPQDHPDGSEHFDPVAIVYGDAPQGDTLVRPARRADFAPWHHPVKQIVRDYQWGDLTKRLVKSRSEKDRETLRYFTLPGADLLDVRFLSKSLEVFQSKIEYFGFNSSYPDDAAATGDEIGAYFSAESALRQAGRTTDNAVVLPDRLEDIAEPGSQAANRLRQQPVFDVVNLDACDHLGFIPKGRKKCLFDALEAMLAHQLKAEKPWLLFITTRADPSLLGSPTFKLQAAISDNLKQHPETFGEALASCIDGSMQTLAGDVSRIWGEQSEAFLKIFVLGLAKHLLQFFHGQANLPATVELASAYAYRVHCDTPDMLSLAFRVTPSGLQVHPPTADIITAGSALELNEALAAVDRVSKLWMLDGGLEDETVRSDAVLGTIDLLETSNYDITAWKAWLAAHKVRPITL